jgi:hypothetical protein
MGTVERNEQWGELAVLREHGGGRPHRRGVARHRGAAFWALTLDYADEAGYDDPGGASIIDPEGNEFCVA